MFDKDYSFTGRHAKRVKQLKREFDNDKNSIFSSSIEIYLLAPIIGFLYGRSEDIDKGDKTANILLGAINRVREDLFFNYRLIMLLDEKNEKDFTERVNKAFRDYGSDKCSNDELIYERYVRGGVDMLYEKIIEPSKTSEDYIDNLYIFMKEINERYNKKVPKDSINDLCRLARN